MKTLIPALIATAIINTAAAFDQSHAAWDTLLKKHVQPTGVDYTSFKKDQSKLKAYLKDLSGISTKEFNDWAGPDQLAYLTNLYNASTIDLVLEHYPIKSFKDEVGGKEGPWKHSFIKALGKTYTLDQIEHELIRKHYAEPRVHFALNCASAGCPPLRSEAFIGENLEKQLEEQTSKFLGNAANNSLNGKNLKLSPIFDWFKEDFIKKSGSVEAFVNPYFPDTSIKKGDVKLSYSDYGWNLNDI